MVRNPGMVGVVTGRTRPRGDTTSYQVRFSNQTIYVPSTQLEKVDSEVEDPYDLLGKGKFGGVSDLRQGLTHVRLTGFLCIPVQTRS
jgi:hypothetical protein